jgi:hypothetical protein
MIDLNELYLFGQVVERKGFASAGRALNLPKSTVSRKISQLEERLGVRLLQRSTRRLSVTEIGEIYYRHCAAMLAEAEAAQDAIDSAQAEPRGRLRITCPVSLMQSYMADILSRFLARYPRVSIDVETTNRRVDVIEEGIEPANHRRRARPYQCSRRSRRARKPRVFSQLGPQSQHAEARVGLAPRRWKGMRGGIRASLCHRRYGSVAACRRTGQRHRAIAGLYGKRAIALRKLGRCAARLGVDFRHHSCGFLVAPWAIYSLAKLHRFRRSSLRSHWLGLDQT